MVPLKNLGIYSNLYCFEWMLEAPHPTHQEKIDGIYSYEYILVRIDIFYKNKNGISDDDISTKLLLLPLLNCVFLQSNAQASIITTVIPL